MTKFNFEKIKKSITPYFIAEAGVNHEGSLKEAKKLIQAAKAGGADAIKFQTYKANKIASKNSPYYWNLKKKELEVNLNFFQSTMLLMSLIIERFISIVEKKKLSLCQRHLTLMQFIF